MKYTLLFFTGLFLALSKAGSSQTTCSKNKLLGDWYYFTTFHPVTKINVDSFKNRLKTDTARFFIKITFSENETRTILSGNKPPRITPYRMDTINCKIIYGKRKKPRYTSISVIEYMDDKCLFLTKWNPHGPWTTFYYRK